MSERLLIGVGVILECAAAAFGVPAREIRSSRRNAAAAEARLACYWLARETTGHTYETIGRALGGRDHSTVQAGAKAIDERRAAEPEFAATLDGLRAAVRIIANSNLAHMLRDADAVAAAERIARDPLREAQRASTLDVAAIAARLLDLEDLAGATYALLLHVDAFAAARDGRELAPLRAARALVPTIASALEALGYASEETEQTGEAA